MPFGSWKTICSSRMDVDAALVHGCGDIHPQEVDLPCGQFLQADDGFCHGAFSATRFADDAQRASAPDGEADIVRGLHVTAFLTPQ